MNSSREWHKLDLSTDVIKFAAPEVEHIHLYWSGNAAVLKGWSCPQGLPWLYTNKRQLKTVTLHASPVSYSRLDETFSLGSY